MSIEQDILSGGFTLKLGEPVTAVYCDAGIIATPGEKIVNPSKLGCVWAYVHVTENEEISKEGWGGYLCNNSVNHFNMFSYVGADEIESNVAEYIAAYRCLKELPEDGAGSFTVTMKIP